MNQLRFTDAPAIDLFQRVASRCMQGLAFDEVKLDLSPGTIATRYLALHPNRRGATLGAGDDW